MFDQYISTLIIPNKKHIIWQFFPKQWVLETKLELVKLDQSNNIDDM